MNRMIYIFKELGLSEYETRSYLSILRLPRSTAPTIARESKIPTSKIYDVMNRLETKGFVLVEPGKPRKYRAIDPQIALQSHMKSKKAILDEREKILMEELAKIQIADERKGVWVLKGRDNVEKTIEKVIKNSKENLLIRCSSDRLFLEDLASGLSGVKIDFRNNAIGHNMINSDGREMIMYLNKKEAVWIKNRKYCRVNDRSVVNHGLDKYTDI